MHAEFSARCAPRRARVGANTLLAVRISHRESLVLGASGALGRSPGALQKIQHI